MDSLGYMLPRVCPSGSEVVNNYVFIRELYCSTTFWTEKCNAFYFTKPLESISWHCISFIKGKKNILKYFFFSKFPVFYIITLENKLFYKTNEYFVLKRFSYYSIFNTLPDEFCYLRLMWPFYRFIPHTDLPILSVKYNLICSYIIMQRDWNLYISTFIIDTICYLNILFWILDSIREIFFSKFIFLTELYISVTVFFLFLI